MKSIFSLSQGLQSIVSIALLATSISTAHAEYVVTTSRDCASYIQSLGGDILPCQINLICDSGYLDANSSPYHIAKCIEGISLNRNTLNQTKGGGPTSYGAVALCYKGSFERIECAHNLSTNSFYRYSFSEITKTCNPNKTELRGQYERYCGWPWGN